MGDIKDSPPPPSPLLTDAFLLIKLMLIHAHARVARLVSLTFTQLWAGYGCHAFVYFIMVPRLLYIKTKQHANTRYDSLFYIN